MREFKSVYKCEPEHKDTKKKYLLGTANEIAVRIAKELAEQKEDIVFPEISFAIADEKSDLNNDGLADIAERSEGWYGVEAVETSFTRGERNIKTLIGDYWGGGCAVAGVLWLDELDDERYTADCIANVMMRAIEIQEVVNENTVFIAEYEEK